MYPHERSLVEEMKDKPFALIGVNSDKELARAKKAVAVAETTSAGMATGALPPLAAMMPAALTASRLEASRKADAAEASTKGAGVSSSRLTPT